jgi:hypothetical protein
VALLLARAHRAGLFDGAAVEEELLGEGGLSRVGVGNDGKGAPARHLAAELVVQDLRNGCHSAATTRGKECIIPLDNLSPVELDFAPTS